MTTTRVKMARIDWPKLRDTLEPWLVFAWVVFLYVFFVSAPLRIGAIYGPGWGVLVALLGFPIWGTMGVAPRPGCFSFLEWGLCITGYLMILLSGIGTTLKLLMSLIWH